MGLPAGVLKINPAIVVDEDETAADVLARRAGAGTGGGEPMTRELG
jgi:hypothetical protein